MNHLTACGEPRWLNHRTRQLPASLTHYSPPRISTQRKIKLDQDSHSPPPWEPRLRLFIAPRFLVPRFVPPADPPRHSSSHASTDNKSRWFRSLWSPRAAHITPQLTEHDVDFVATRGSRRPLVNDIHQWQDELSWSNEGEARCSPCTGRRRVWSIQQVWCGGE